MTPATNVFKERLLAREQQIGLWLAMAEATVAEVCADAGFDWLLIDAEHGPNELRSILAQLRAIGPNSQPVVRLRDTERSRIKQVLDLGAQSLLLPMIETAEQAHDAVHSVLYPPLGVRGVGSSLARASGYGRNANYLHTANDQICLLLQVESVAGVAALEEILEVERVDGIFVGPADLAADMGFLGRPGAPEVQEQVIAALARIRAAGKAAGILTADAGLAAKYAAMGVEFLAVGSDVGALTLGLRTVRSALAY